MRARRKLGAVPIALSLTGLAACAGAPPPSAGPVAAPASTGPAPGQWQLVIEVEDAKGAAKNAPQTMTLCSTPEDKRQWQDMVGGKTAAGCAVRDYLVSGARISYRMQCAGGIEGSTVINVVDDDHYGGESRLALSSGAQSAVIRSRLTATRTAATCKK